MIDIRADTCLNAATGKEATVLLPNDVGSKNTLQLALLTAAGYGYPLDVLSLPPVIIGTSAGVDMLARHILLGLGDPDSLSMGFTNSTEHLGRGKQHAISVESDTNGTRVVRLHPYNTESQTDNLDLVPNTVLQLTDGFAGRIDGTIGILAEMESLFTASDALSGLQ